MPFLYSSTRQIQATRMMNLHMEKKLIKENKLVELQLFKKKMYIELYDNWGILILNKVMDELLQKRWDKIHLNHSDRTLFCSDFRCPKHKPLIFDENSTPLSQE